MMETALLAASRNKHENCVHLLIDSGANVNHKDSDRETPLTPAIHRDSVNVLRLLLDAGADPHNAPHSSPNSGFTPLMVAAYLGHKDCLEILIKEGVDVNKIHDDRT